MSQPAQLEEAGKGFDEAKKQAEGVRKELDKAGQSVTGVGSKLADELKNSRAVDTRVKPTDTAPTGAFPSFTQEGQTQRSIDLLKKPVDVPVTFDKAPAFTDAESIASYYRKVLDEAKKSGNTKLQADVEKYLDDLDKAVRKSNEAGAKIKQALEQRDEKVRSLLPTERQGVMADLDFKNSLKAAEDARAQIDAILAEQGMEPLVDPKQEFKNAEDIANYYRRTQDALTKAGKADLLTKEPFSKLTDAMNKNDSSAKDQDRVKGVQDSRAIQSKEAELAKANANNDPRRAAQLETELALMKEQQSIAAALNLTGKDGQAEAKKLAAGKVSDDLKVRLNEQMAEMNPLQNRPKQLGSGATAMNQLFGRKSNDGLIEQAKEQTKYLKELVKLAGIKESIKFVATLA